MSISTGLGSIEMTALSGFALHAAYSISKAALTMINLKYALDLKEEGFIFLAMSPGYGACSYAPYLMVGSTLLADA